MLRKRIKTLFACTLSTLLLVCDLRADSLSFPGSDAATVGLMVVDLQNDRIVCAENEAKAMIPASILKSVTTASALSLKGADYSFKTDVVLTGAITGTAASGNLVVKASTDPTINSQYFPECAGFAEAVINALRQRGITEIKGDIIIDDTWFADPGQNPQWAVGDIGWSYGAGTFGFNYCDNIFSLNTQTRETQPEIPNLDITLTRTSTPVDIIRGIDSDNIVVVGDKVGVKGYTVQSTMSNPGIVLRAELRKKLAAAGIKLGGAKVAPAGETVIYTRISPRLEEIMQSLMFRSDNMMAETVLRTLAFGDTRDNAIKAELNFWNSKGISTSGVRLFDGSGLARADRVTPRFMAEVLKFMAKSSNASTYVSFFPKVGLQGTVQGLLAKSRLKGSIALKSGSINGVQCFAGYRLNTDGRPTHVVVIMVNNFFCSRTTLRNVIENWLLEIF